FHVVFDQDMCVIGQGKRISSLCPSVSRGDPFCHHFEISRPRDIKNFDDICKNIESLYIVRLSRTPIELRGEMIRLRGSLTLFLCSPLVRSIGELETLGLSLQDFPLHDPTGDLLFLLQAQRSTIEEAKALNQRLLAINESLRKYVPVNFLR